MDTLKRTIVGFFILFLSIANFTSCNNDIAKQSKKLKLVQKNTIGIILTNNTALRLEPFIFSSKIAQLPKGTAITVLKKSAKKSYIGRKSNYWYQIKLETGFIGWTYGRNIQIIKKNSSKEMSDYVSAFWESEKDELQKKLAGKWWSVNKFNDFTNHCIELYEDGKYKSYYNGNEKYAKTGEYNFDFNENKIIFLKGTSFHENLIFERRGQTFILKKSFKKGGEIRFKKISAIERLKSSNKKKEEEEKKKKLNENKNK